MMDRLCVFLIALVLWAGVGTDETQATMYTFNPVADVSVGQIPAGIRSGGNNLLLTGNGMGPSYIYLKFFLGDIPDNERITGATLGLFCLYGSRTWIDVHYLADDSWQENSIPGYLGGGVKDMGPLLDKRLGRNLNPYCAPHWMKWNLFATGLWNPEAEQGDQYLSLVLKAKREDLFFLSREFFYPKWRPFLNVTTVTSNNTAEKGPAPVPEPSTVVLMLAGMVFGSMIPKRFWRYRSSIALSGNAKG